MEGDSPYSVLFFIALAFGYICGRSKCDEEKAILWIMYLLSDILFWVNSLVEIVFLTLCLILDQNDEILLVRADDANGQWDFVSFGPSVV